MSDINRLSALPELIIVTKYTEVDRGTSIVHWIISTKNNENPLVYREIDNDLERLDDKWVKLNDCEKYHTYSIIYQYMQQSQYKNMFAKL